VLNAPGLLDADYRGELHVVLINLGRDRFTVERGARIARLAFSPTAQPGLVEVAVEDLFPPEHQPRGFGSTGKP
jgi:dUTP pyrophosphatase